MEELTEKWTGDDLGVYINMIRETERDRVYGQILDKRGLRQFLDTPDGRLLLKDAVNIIRTELGEIYKLAIADARANTDKIVASVDRYKAALDIMHRWIGMIKLGEHHEKELKKIVKKRKG